MQKNFPGRKNLRRIRALERLKEMKRTGHTLKEKIPLEEQDRVRLNFEIQHLESLIMEQDVATTLKTKKDRTV